MNKKTMGLLLCMLVAGTATPLSAQQDEKTVNLNALYEEIDEAIENTELYVSQRVLEIDRQRDFFQRETDGEKKLLQAEELFALFKPYKNDSALHYAQVCINLADSLQHPDVAGRYRALMARQCSNAGMYVESSGILQSIDKSKLDRQGLTEYYDACMHVCGEVAAYTLLPKVRDYYFAEQDHYRDSLMMYADKGSDQYLHLLMSNLVARKQYQEALAVSDQWINKTAEGTHADAYAAYYRHIVYANLKNAEMTRFWLGKSALDDIKCAVMDQAALINLAEVLNQDGDLDRSYRYILFTWKCNSFFNTRMRANQISPVLNVIQKNYQDSIDRNTRFLIIASIIFTLLTLSLLIALRYVQRQKKKIARAQADLAAANEGLSAANDKLQRMNERITKYNKQLFDINNELRKEKEEQSTDD